MGRADVPSAELSRRKKRQACRLLRHGFTETRLASHRYRKEHRFSVFALIKSQEERRVEQGKKKGVSPISLVFKASTRVSMGRADVPSAGLGRREKRQACRFYGTVLRRRDWRRIAAPRAGDATSVASLHREMETRLASHRYTERWGRD